MGPALEVLESQSFLAPAALPPSIAEAQFSSNNQMSCPSARASLWAFLPSSLFRKHRGKQRHLYCLNVQKFRYLPTALLCFFWLSQ